MIYPIIITPNFLIQIKDDEKLLNKFSKFVSQFKEYWDEIFILLDDKNNSFLNEYKKIKEKYGHESFDFSLLCDLLISSNKSKIISLDEKFDNGEEIIKYLKKKRIKNFISFPQYFENENISLKKTLHKVLLSSLSEDEAIEKIVSVTRFSKNIVLIDPNIADALTNFSLYNKRFHNNDCTQIKSKINDENDFVYSLNKIIKAIYYSNVFKDKDEIKIQIRTTLNDSKLNHFKFNIIENMNKWKYFENAKSENKNEFLFPLKKNKPTDRTKKYQTLYDGMNYFSLIEKKLGEKEEDFNKRIKLTNILNVENKIKIEKQISSFTDIGNLIKTEIEKCTSNIISNLKPSVIINEHYKNLSDETEPEQDIYFRHILAVDLRSSIELRKRLDIFDGKKKKLKNINSWYLNLEVGPDEKISSFNIFTHNIYKPKEIIYN